MGNQQITANWLGIACGVSGYFDATHTIRVDEQKSAIESVTRLMKQASKAGGGGKRAREFIISDPSAPDSVVIVEYSSWSS